MRNFRSLLIAVIVLAAGAGFVLGGTSFHAPVVSEASSTNVDGDNNGPAPQSYRNDGSVAWSHGRDGSDANADEHWRKHGNEFSEDHNAQEYEDEASSFVHHPPPGAEIKHRANGDTLIYDRDSNTFAVENRDGEPRTMFKPDRGESYWDRQH